MAPAKLTPKDARAYAAADARVAAAKAALDEAKADLDAERDRLRPKLRDGVAATAGGVTLRRSLSHPETFTFAKYKEAGNKVTAAMARFVSRGERETWTCKRIA